jgi:hypothetical protein
MQQEDGMKNIISKSTWLWYNGRGIVYQMDGGTQVYYSGNVPAACIKKFNAIKG